MTTAQYRVLALVSHNHAPPLDLSSVEALRDLIKSKMVMLQRGNDNRPSHFALTPAGKAAWELARETAS